MTVVDETLMVESHYVAQPINVTSTYSVEGDLPLFITGASAYFQASIIYTFRHMHAKQKKAH